MPYDLTIKQDDTEIRKQIEELEELKEILQELSGKDYTLTMKRKWENETNTLWTISKEDKDNRLTK